jgi:sarcosine oxidase gamma subunit
VIDLAFLSPDRADPTAVWRSPLERALAHLDESFGIRDISRTGKIEVRGEIGELEIEGAEAFWITPRRALVICDYDKTAGIREALRERFLAVDVTAALAGLEVRGERLMRRLTDLDLENLPAPGPIAHVQAVVLRDADETFRIFFPQEYGDYLAEVIVDAAKGLRRS